jgi:pilus assembly protein FimV
MSNSVWPVLSIIVGAILLILGGYGIYRLSRRARKDSAETSFLESRLQPDSFFGASGGQHIDTRNETGAASSMNYSLSQIDAIGDVDPVAEADVYLAYGRDLQAEEILKEAIRSNPDRLAIRTKLLEVYAKRRDVKSFEQLATQLFEVTQGQGDDWARAQELGSQIDPDNLLYRPGGTPASRAPVPQPEPALSVEEVTPSQLDDSRLGLDFPIPETPVAAPEPVPVSMAKEAPVDSVDLDFDIDLAEPAPVTAIPSPEFKIPDISLDLDASPSANGVTDSAEVDFDLDDDGRDPLVRKFELAEEFRQIGDMEGARDLLQEVVGGADGPLKSKAQALLQAIG